MIEPSGILNAELAEKGEYTSAANDLIMDLSTRPRPREVVVSGGASIAEHLFKAQRLKRPLRKWQREMGESFLTAYVYTISETWHELDRSQAGSLVDQGLEETRRRRAYADFDPIDLKDAGQRAYYAVLGLAATRAAHLVAGLGAQSAASIEGGWGPFYAYLIEQPSYQRIESMNEVHEAVHHVLVKKRHLEEYQRGHQVSWSVGIASGFLDILGELP